MLIRSQMLSLLSYRCWRCRWTTSSQLKYAYLRVLLSRVLLNLLKDYRTKTVENGGPGREDVALLCIKLYTPYFQLVYNLPEVRGVSGRSTFPSKVGSCPQKSCTVDFTASSKSLMWHRKSKGLNTVSWGTPESTAIFRIFRPPQPPSSGGYLHSF